MKLIYDSEVDALYFRLLDDDIECRTVQLSEEISLNIGPDEQLVGIEVLDASHILNMKQKKPSVLLQNIEQISAFV